MAITLQQAMAGVSFWDLWDADHVGLLALAMALAYLAVTGPLRGRIRGATSPTRTQRSYFLLGCLVMYAALGTPLDLLSDHYLMSAHMLEHMLLIFACAPMLLAGTPDWLARLLLGRGVWRWFWANCVRPAPALGIFITVLSLWHFPILYDLTLTNNAVHFTEHATFLIIGLMVWWPLLSPLPEMPRLSDGAQLIYLFIEEVLMTAPFAIITFASHPFYAFYEHVPRLWGISPLDDQIFGGIIMRLASALSMGVGFAKGFFTWFASQSHIDPVSPPPSTGPHVPVLNRR